MKIAFPLFSFLLWSANLSAQVTEADYQRANSLREKLQALALNVPGPMNWIEGTDRFWYRKSVEGGHAFVVVDADKLSKSPAFDHDKLARSLDAASGEKYTAVTLPFSEIAFVDHERAIELAAAGSEWRCELSSYECKKTGPVHNGFGRGGRPPEADPAEDSPLEYGNDVDDGMVSPQQDQRAGRGGGPAQETSKASPDGKWEALIQNYNVFLRPHGSKDATPLSWDGSEGNYYTLASIAWSPDSQRLAAFRVRPGYKREVHYVESSPADQLQPKHSTREYAKPGDALDVAQPELFDIEKKIQTVIDNALFPNAYSLSRPVWWKDGRGFTFEYNQRGHQVYRVIEVDASSGKARALISEESATFIDYRALNGNARDTGKKVRYDVDDGKEIVWGSERDGWEHLDRK